MQALDGGNEMQMQFVRISAMAIQIGDKPAADGLRVVNSSHVVVGGHAPVGKDHGQVESLDDGQSITMMMALVRLNYFPSRILHFFLYIFCHF